MTLTNDELRKQILEFLRIENVSVNDEKLKTLARAIRDVCADGTTVDLDKETVANTLRTLSDVIISIANDIEDSRTY